MDMYKYVCLFAFLVFSAVAVHSNESNYSGNTLGIRDLRAFLEMHMEYCGFYEFCHHKPTLLLNWEIPKENALYPQCCPPCSCDERCETDGNCCPDYRLKERLGHTVFSTLDEMFSVLDQNVSVEIPGSRPASLKKSNQCVSSRLFSDINLRGPILQGYQMHGRCPRKAFEGYNPRDGLTASCEHTDVRSAKSTVPVVSIESGKIYKNVNCLECNEQTVNFTPFLVQLTCSGRLESSVGQPLLMLEAVQQGKHPDSLCNVLYLPPASVAHTVDTCEIIDEVSELCLDNSNISNLCRTFHLPVNVEDDASIAAGMVRNVACVHCATDTYKTKTCSAKIPLRLEYKLQLQLTPTIEITMQTQKILASKMKSESHRKYCKQGYIYDQNIVSFIVICLITFYCPH